MLAELLISLCLSSPDTLAAASVTAEKGTDKVIPAQTLSGKELERLRTVSAADAIRYFAGVQIKDYGGAGGLKTVNVRSLGAEQTGVFLDGVQLGNAQNGQVDLGRFSLENLESVSLFGGQKSSVLQSAKDYASAASIYLQSRTASFGGGKPWKLKFGLNGGSFGTINPTAHYDRRIGRITNSLDASYLCSNGKYKFSYTKKDGYDTTAVRSNGDLSALRIEDGISGRMEGGSWKARAYFYSSDRGYPGAFVRQTPGTFANRDRQTDNDLFLQGSMVRSFGRYSISAKAKGSLSWLHYVSDPNLNLATMYADNRYFQKELYLSVAQEYALLPWLDLSYAADGQMNALDANLTDFAYPVRKSFYQAPALSLHHGKARFQANLLHTLSADRVTDAVSGSRTAGSSQDVLAPAFIAGFGPWNSLSFRAFWKKIFRMPTLNDLYYTFIGNASLEPETSVQRNFGLSWEAPGRIAALTGFGFSADAYLNSIENKIVAIPATNLFRWTMANLGRVEVLGTDLSAHGNIRLGTAELSARLCYTFQRSRDLSNPDSEWYGGQIPYTPRHSGSAVVSANSGPWNFTWSWLYTGERWTSSANLQENHLQPWYTSDCALSYTPRKDLRIFLNINNIFNQQYEVVRCYPMPGINFRTGFTIEL